MRNAARYWAIVIERDGEGPWPCHGCGLPARRIRITRRSTGTDRITAAVVHHLDEDESNDASENLVVMHHGCHSSHHSAAKIGRPRTEETKEKIAAAIRGRRLTAATRTKLRQRTFSDVTRLRISEAKQGIVPTNFGAFQAAADRRVQCGGCSLVTRPGPLKRHQAASGHAGNREITGR